MTRKERDFPHGEALGDEGIARRLDEWGAMWGVAGLGARCDVRFGRRMRSSLGRCYPSRGRITLNPVLKAPANEKIAVEVLCHEAAHLAAHILHGRTARPHGREWKKLLAAAGYEPRVRIDPGEISQLKICSTRSKYEYSHSCRDCGAEFKAFRTDRRWRCARCREAGREGRFHVRRKSRAGSGGGILRRIFGK